MDLNRNFDWNYGFKGSSKNKDDEEFRGSGPFSEPECQVLLELTSQYQFDCFVSFHSGIRQIYVPFAGACVRSITLNTRTTAYKMLCTRTCLCRINTCTHCFVRITAFFLSLLLNIACGLCDADTLSKEKNLKPKNFDQMMELGKQMAAAASMRKPFSYGVAYNINDYTADGTIFDYMAGNRKVKE